MLDLQKAFDTVDHVILGKKLKAIGVKSVDLFMSYLSNRSQIVHVNNTQSDPSLVTCGVPQGSILGPLLFLCYVNDMEISTSSGFGFEGRIWDLIVSVPDNYLSFYSESKLLLYADDSAVLYSHKDPEVIYKKKNLVQNWSRAVNGWWITKYLCIWEKQNVFFLGLRENSERQKNFILSAMVIKLRHKTRLNIWDSTWTMSCQGRQL